MADSFILNGFEIFPSWYQPKNFIKELKRQGAKFKKYNTKFEVKEINPLINAVYKDQLEIVRDQKQLEDWYKWHSEVDLYRTLISEESDINKILNKEDTYYRQCPFLILSRFMFLIRDNYKIEENCSKKITKPIIIECVVFG